MKIVQKLSTSTDWPADAIPQSWIESLFEKMLFTYGAKFSDQWKNIDPVGLKRHWATQLGSLTATELKTGVVQLESREWPPTLPEFLKLCRPGLNVDAAIYEAVEQLQKRREGKDVWSHPAIYWTAIKVGHHEMTTLSHSMVKPRFASVLAEMLAKPDLEPIPVSLPSLPGMGQGQSTRENAGRMVAEIKATYVQKTTATPIDHKRWAKLIKEREKRGDATLTIYQINEADMALRAA